GDADGDAEGTEVTLAGEVAEPLLDAGRVRQHGDPRAAPARLGQAELRGHPPLLPEGADIRGYYFSTVGRSTGAEGSAGTAAGCAAGTPLARTILDAAWPILFFCLLTFPLPLRA